jgi:hypothetical protein
LRNVRAQLSHWSIDHHCTEESFQRRKCDYFGPFLKDGAESHRTSLVTTSNWNGCRNFGRHIPVGLARRRSHAFVQLREYGKQRWIFEGEHDHGREDGVGDRKQAISPMKNRWPAKTLHSIQTSGVSSKFATSHPKHPVTTSVGNLPSRWSFTPSLFLQITLSPPIKANQA